MSYGFSMAFTPCNSFERALMIGAQCSDLLRKPENTKHLINDNLIFLPSLRYHDDVNPFSDGNWLHRFFTMRFVYWDSQKILGLVIDKDVYKRQVIVVSVFAAGAMTVQWLGTLIDARGIGSGLSMLIFAGIVSRWSGTVSVIRQIAERVAAGQWGYMAVGVFLLAFMLASLLYAVCLNAAEKRIPVQYAGKNGNRGAGSFIPVRLVTGGVMPVSYTHLCAGCRRA